MGKVILLEALSHSHFQLDQLDHGFNCAFVQDVIEFKQHWACEPLNRWSVAFVEAQDLDLSQISLITWSSALKHLLLNAIDNFEMYRCNAINSQIRKRVQKRTFKRCDVPVAVQLTASEDYIKQLLKSVFKPKSWERERDASERLAVTLKELQSSVTKKY